MNALLFGGPLHKREIENLNDKPELIYAYTRTACSYTIELIEKEPVMENSNLYIYLRTEIYDKERNYRLYSYESRDRTCRNIKGEIIAT